MLARPPQIHRLAVNHRRSHGLAAVGTHERAVQVNVCMARGTGGQQGAVQPGRDRGQHVDALMEIAVGGRQTDLVVHGELGDPGGVAEPAHHQDRLLPRA